MMHDRYSLPNGDEADYHYVRTGGSTMVVPVTADGTLVMIRQHRYLIGRASTEFPCGGVATDDLTENAAKELREETGLVAGRLERVGGFAPYNGVADEICHVYLARDLDQREASPEPTELMQVVRHDVDEIAAMIARNELWDGMTIAAFALVRGMLAT